MRAHIVLFLCRALVVADEALQKVLVALLCSQDDSSLPILHGNGIMTEACQVACTVH